MSDHLRNAILAYTDSHARTPDGLVPTELPQIALIRHDHETPLQHGFYDPALVVVVQGAKHVMLGETRFAYTAGHYLVVSVGMPVLASITDASPDHPYLALALTIDRNMLNELIDGIDRSAAPQAASARIGLFVGTLGEHQANAIERLVALLATPDALRALYPSITRELFYWTLAGRDGAELMRIALADSHTQRIGAAINTMRADLTQTIPVDQLAAIAHMSPSSFHQHFKAVTSMSPLQYQKQLRLLEARRLMIANGTDATRAAYHVGYESTSQFSREYARMFGAPPRRDVTAQRSA
jgi:AraC-like DNA-binding protein